MFLPAIATLYWELANFFSFSVSLALAAYLIEAAVPLAGLLLRKVCLLSTFNP